MESLAHQGCIYFKNTEKTVKLWNIIQMYNIGFLYYRYIYTILSSRTVSKIDKKNLHIRIISEGSCDTEDWSNDVENSALITDIKYILNYIKIGNQY